MKASGRYLKNILTLVLCMSAYAMKAQITDTLPIASSDSDFLAAIKAYNEGDTGKAAGIFSGILSEEPDNDAVHFYLGMISMGNGNIHEAVMLMERAVELDPDNYWYNIRLGQIYRAAGELEKATGIYMMLKEKYPDKYDNYYTLIELLSAGGKYGEAEKIIADAEAVMGRNEYTTFSKLNIMLTENRVDDALAELLVLRTEMPSAKLMTLEGDLYSEKSDYTAASECYDRALDIEPGFPYAAIGKAELAVRLNDKDSFFRNIGTFLTGKADAEAKVKYLSTVERNGTLKKFGTVRMDSVVSAMHSAYPTDSTIVKSVSDYYLITGRIEKSMEVSEKYLEHDIRNRGAINNIIFCLISKGEWDRLAEKTAELYSSNGIADMLHISAIASSEAGDIETAIETTDRYLKIAEETDNTEMKISGHLLKAEFLIASGNAAKGFREYEKALGIDRDNPMALNNYAYNLAVIGKSLNKAYQMSRKTIEMFPDDPTYLDTYAWILHLKGMDKEAKDVLKHAMLYGGNENAVILDHYAEILFSLKEYDMAFLYWMQASKKDPSMGLDKKIEQKKAERKELEKER